MNDLSRTINQEFCRKTVVIIGDLVADQYLNGTISRVSREAPVFILRHDETLTFPGAAANAAANVSSLGGTSIIVGIVGQDTNGELLLSSLELSGVDCSNVIVVPDLATTTKVRVVAGQQHASRQQVIRIDYDNKKAPDAEILDLLRTKVVEAIKVADAVIISDYDYGAAGADIFETALSSAAERNIPILVDSRFRLTQFKNANSATPNQDEVEQLLGPDFTESDCSKLCRDLGFEALLVTNGSKGMMLFEKDRSPRNIDAVGSDQAVDVTGAGDTVIAAYALSLASGLNYFDSATIANFAGGLVVMKKGTATVELDELIASIKSNNLSDASKSVG